MASDDDRTESTLREFRCLDRLWETFEQISEDQEKPIGELINDAMASYAQLAGYEPTEQGRTPPPTPAPEPLPTPPPRAARPPVPLATPVPPAVEDGLAGATLYLVFDNQKYRIDKDQFIIGRGSKSSDLPIKDGNISRKHAAVIRRNGTFYIKDLGSTNGIDFKGMRIDNKRIDEGDVFHICEYELKFTYKR